MPLFQNESWYKNLLYENEFDLRAQKWTRRGIHFHMNGLTRRHTRCDREAHGNSEVAYSIFK